MTDFERAVGFVLAHEGGYSNNPADPGGETKYGISKRAYPNLNIAALTEDDAKTIYYRDYWEPSGAAELPLPLSAAVLDTAVNQGVVASRDLLHQSGGDFTTYLNLREARYRALAAAKPSLAQFLTGWLNRVADLRVWGWL